jgi:DNA-binding response OmpR family regulator
MDSKIKVLAVDDDRLLRLSMELLLEEQGYDVDTVASLATAMDALDQYRYDLVFTDLTLPDGNGLQVVRYARQSNPDSKVILFTGSEDGLDVDEILRAGACEVIFKPCKLSLLVSKARVVLADGRVPPDTEIPV